MHKVQEMLRALDTCRYGEAAGKDAGHVAQTGMS